MKKIKNTLKTLEDFSNKLNSSNNEVIRIRNIGNGWSAFDFNTLEMIHKVFTDKEIKVLIENRIKELKKNGFYVDMGERQDSELNFVQSLKEMYDKNDLKFIDPSKCIEGIFSYKEECGRIHTFYHFKPDDFKFTYVDFSNFTKMYDVVSTTSLHYLNSFWGIYIENRKLGMHDLIQPDFFHCCWRIMPYNLYDGGNILLENRERYPLGITTNHCGAIFGSWDEFVKSNIKWSEFQILQEEKDIENLKKEIAIARKNIRESNKSITNRQKFYDSIEDKKVKLA